MARLTNAMPTTSLTTDDLRFLAYVQHMALTAQSEAARQMFQEYMHLEKQHLTAPALTGMQALPDIPGPGLDRRASIGEQLRMKRCRQNTTEGGLIR